MRRVFVIAAILGLLLFCRPGVGQNGFDTGINIIGSVPLPLNGGGVANIKGELVGKRIIEVHSPVDIEITKVDDKKSLRFEGQVKMLAAINARGYRQFLIGRDPEEKGNRVLVRIITWVPKDREQVPGKESQSDVTEFTLVWK